MQEVVFDPLLPLNMIAALALMSFVVLIAALWRGLTGWWLRALAAMVLLFALAGPSVREEDREPVANIALIVSDISASNKIAGRSDQVRDALDALERELALLGETGRLDVRVSEVTDSADDGTRLLEELARLAAGVPAERIAGAILVTDGQVHDAGFLEDFPAPVHVLLTGSRNEFDRRVVIEAAPAFAIVDEQISVKLSVEDVGAAPKGVVSVPLQISLDGNPPIRFEVPLNETVTLPVTLRRGGQNVLQISTPEADGELTTQNNVVVVSINGVRDRLRVLLVSGEPYPGERTWRNLLKSDSAVDLVHFTILRPPDKQDFVPVFELSLIAFPTQELFMEKVDEFDLIIFDRYRRRGILPGLYFDNIARYVRDGGALLIATGADFAGAESLYRTPLSDIIPVRPTARFIEEGYIPLISEIGERHPVTSGLAEFAPRLPDAEGMPGWGRWMGMVETDAIAGETVMTGPDERPLLVLDRQGEGRIAVLATDQAWLWSRGFEGGGPQVELLRRLAHWLMKEPELEEEVLRGSGVSGDVRILRRTLGQSVAPVTAIGPSGESVNVEMTETAPGKWEGSLDARENGVWRLQNEDVNSVAVVGPSSPKEFSDPVSTPDLLAPLVRTSRGDVFRVENEIPEARFVREGRVAAGRGWFGLVDREAYLLRDVREADLLPGWVLMLLAGGLAFAAWRVEGR